MITEQLIKQAQQGNSDAFTKIYNETIKTAYYVAKRILLDEQAIEDVLQEAYIAVYEHLDDFKAGNFQGWVDTIVANRSKNYLRKKNPILFSQMETDDNPIVEFEEEKIEFRPEENVDYKETKRLVMNIVDGLSDDQRLTTILFYFEQKNIKEIAEICECSENTVKSRLNYARKKIKEEVLELEKKGTKLYCAPILPFLYWLFREEFKASTVSTVASGNIASAVQKAVSESAKEGAGVASTTTVQATVAQAATTDAIAKTGMALGTKIAIGVLATVVVVGGGVGAVMAYNHFVIESNYENDEEREDEDRQDDIDTEFSEPVDVTSQYTQEELDMYQKLIMTMAEYLGGPEVENASFSAEEIRDGLKMGLLNGSLYRNDVKSFASLEESGLITSSIRIGYGGTEYNALHFTEESYLTAQAYLWQGGLSSSDAFRASYNADVEDGVAILEDGSYEIWPHEGDAIFYTIKNIKIFQTSETTYRIEAVADMTYQYSTMPDYTVVLETVKNEKSPFAGMTITNISLSTVTEEEGARSSLVNGDLLFYLAGWNSDSGVVPYTVREFETRIYSNQVTIPEIRDCSTEISDEWNTRFYTDADFRSGTISENLETFEVIGMNENYLGIAMYIYYDGIEDHVLDEIVVYHIDMQTGEQIYLDVNQTEFMSRLENGNYTSNEEFRLSENTSIDLSNAYLQDAKLVVPFHGTNTAGEHCLIIIEMEL